MKFYTRKTLISCLAIALAATAGVIALRVASTTTIMDRNCLHPPSEVTASPTSISEFKFMNSRRSLLKSFEMDEQIIVEPFTFKRINDSVFATSVQVDYYNDPIVVEVKRLGAQVLPEGLNIVIGILNGYCVCHLTKTQTVSAIAKEYSFGKCEGDVERNTLLFETIERTTNLRPYFASEDALFCEIVSDASESEIARIVKLTAHLMSPEALDDIEPTEYANRFKEFRFSYSP